MKPATPPDSRSGAPKAPLPGDEPRIAPNGSVVPGAVLPVSLLVGSARLILERHLGLVWVAGEISGFTRAASGHCYFNLKDASAQVRCVFFRQKAQFAGFVLQDGLAVEVRATPSIYEARGEFQLNVETVRLAGVGALYEKFARMKARLEAAGYFAPERKRALPRFPRVVGIVTSPRAAALKDVLTTLARRWPSLRVVVYPAAVQGEGAAAGLADSVRIANARAEVDVLIIGRGGGSIEDLWAFNEEILATAIFESALPVVSGVGHETDFTICDFVADARAPTPTAAAALVAPDRRAVLEALAALESRWQRAIERTLETRMQRVDGFARRLVHPAARLRQQRRDAAALGHRLARAFVHAIAGSRATVGQLERRVAGQLRKPLPQHAALASVQSALLRGGRREVERANVRVAVLAQSLAHLDPRAVLERGYAIVTTADGAVVQDAAQLKVGGVVGLGLAHGSARATVDKIER